MAAALLQTAWDFVGNIDTDMCPFESTVGAPVGDHVGVAGDAHAEFLSPVAVGNFLLALLLC